MTVRKAQESDIDGIEKIYDRIHDSEEQGLSTIGWIRGVYPTRKTAEAALERGDLFVMADGGKVVAGRMLDRKDFICYHWYMHRIAFGKFTMGYPDAIPNCLPDGYGSGRERRTYIQ